MKLYNYFRSSASYRVRIALALKGLDYDYMPVHLARNEQLASAYSALSVTQLVPLLQDGEHLIGQSLAIIEYLEETHPTPALLPAHPAERARVRALALDVACEIHPLNNLRVLRYLVGDLKLSEDDKNRWYRHWVEQGLAAVERQLESPYTGRFCHGETPTLADVVLVPQIFNAQRFNCQLSHVPKVMQVFEACMSLEAFSSTQPANCPDAQA
ncbi:MAG: maleylacetoacetate isomerase [Rhizobacter sp.]